MPEHKTRIDAVMDAISAKIASRAYPPGARLPSVRAQAQAMKVSVSTVVEAYDRLTAREIIRARRGSGFYVAGPAAPLALSEIGPQLDREVDPLWISRLSLETDAQALRPGCGWLPASWMPEAAMRRALRLAARADDTLLADYATPLGLPALRQLLSRRMDALGIDAPPEQILLTESGTQAADLICRFFLSPGDTVLVDDPCYFNFHALLRAHRAKAVGIPFTPNGPDLAAFQAALQAHSPRLYITNSGMHNPTGATLSSVTAHRLLKLADQAKLVIIEDDIYTDLEPSPAPRLAAFDGLTRVIHIGSFSKTLSASLRCGYIAARADWLDDLADLKIATSFASGRLAAEIVFNALTDSSYRKHMHTLQTRLAHAMEKTIPRLQALGITPWLTPHAGMFLWCRLPDDLNAADVARNCLRKNVVLAPGRAFSASPEASSFLRFNVSQSLDNRVFQVLGQALRAR